MVLVGRQEGQFRPIKTEWWDDGVVMCLGQGAHLHMAQLMPLPLTISCSCKSRLVLPFWCQPTRVALDKIQEGCKSVLCVCVWCVCDLCHKFSEIDAKGCAISYQMSPFCLFYFTAV